MKTLIKSILVVAVMLGTYTSYASETLKELPTFKFVNEGHNLSVTDTSGEVIFSGRIKHNGNLVRLFDFSQLNNGIYTVEITKDFEIEVVDLEVNNKEVKILTETQSKIYKPVIRPEEGLLIISKIGLDTNEMKVELYFENELIHTENVEGKDVLNRVYKLDKTVTGEYTAVIKSNGRVYSKNFRI
ncbi:MULTISPECIES: hypothetical protein [Winogradskyella]|jgi:hypothetical protein|uniref:hypothetical protein n=1 Tax=Winogradskyella TaxID=286104 RepID=UPI000C60D9D3|nr:hypothetical protein [Winogradskyella sp. MH6]MAB49688.1 hypothetical protein [Flavobacteriaceae bacterium]MBD09263.1 hypothetical protein [Flavobacteriaceae bacterium]|tara:strand:+ start:424 stop:981 length:558 start_codon:yes stop_codon:yes gene_type:complete